MNLSERLKFLDPMYTTGEGERTDMGDPTWLTELQTFASGLSATSSSFAPQVSDDHVDHNQYNGYDYSQSHYDQGNSYYQPQFQPDSGEQPLEQEVEQAQPDSFSPPRAESVTRKVSQDLTTTSRKSSVSQDVPTFYPPTSMAPPPSFGTVPTLAQVPEMPSLQQPPPPVVKPPSPRMQEMPPSNITNNNAINSQAKESTEPKDSNKPQKGTKQDGKKGQEGSGFLGRILGKFIKAPNQMHLPNDKDPGIVYDPVKKKWIDKNADEEDEAAGAVAPPSDLELSRNNSTADFAGSAAQTAAPNPGAGPPSLGLAPPMGGNKFAGGLAKKRGGLSGRVDVFKNSQSVPASLSDAASTASPPLDPMFAPPAMGTVPTMMNPGPGPVDGGSSGPQFFDPNQFTT